MEGTLRITQQFHTCYLVLPSIETLEEFQTIHASCHRTSQYTLSIYKNFGTKVNMEWLSLVKKSRPFHVHQSETT